MIVDLMIARVNSQARQQGLELEITLEAKEALAKGRPCRTHAHWAGTEDSGTGW